MGIYVFFGAIAASIISFSILRDRQRNNVNHNSLKKQAIILETAQELRAGEKLDDEATWPVIGQLPATGAMNIIKAVKAIQYFTQQVVADGFIITSEANNTKEKYTLDFSNLSLSQKVITLDYRDNTKEDRQFGVVLSLLNVPTESITLQVYGSEANRSFFKSSNNRFVIICNENSHALRVYFAVMNLNSDKKRSDKKHEISIGCNFGFYEFSDSLL